MNFTQLQERVRVELLRRIERGTLSVSLLARQTGLGQPHVSNFLHGRRGLSLGTLDRVLAAQHLAIADLMPAPREARDTLLSGQTGEVGWVPLVSHATALFEPYIRASSVQTMLPLPAISMAGLRERCTSARRQWERFVAVRLGAEDARAMEPVMGVGTLAVLDLHYNSFRPYREGGQEDDRGGSAEGHSGANVYGVRLGAAMVLRYADFKAGRVVLRPYGAGFPLEVVEVGGGETANDLLVGRVALVLKEI
jgi:transcriptional regulator with XRE-family HTH domain